MRAVHSPSPSPSPINPLRPIFEGAVHYKELLHVVKGMWLIKKKGGEKKNRTHVISTRVTVREAGAAVWLRTGVAGESVAVALAPMWRKRKLVTTRKAIISYFPGRVEVQYEYITNAKNNNNEQASAVFAVPESVFATLALFDHLIHQVNFPRNLFRYVCVIALEFLIMTHRV